MSIDDATSTAAVEIWGYDENNKDTYYYYLTWSVPESTGISSISADSKADAPAYNLAGQRVSKAAKGLVIMNGKKYFNK